MHTSLDLVNLALLPVSMRRFAIRAANGSLLDLQRLVLIFLKLSLDDERFTYSLPALYAVLDPARIPPEDPASDSPAVVAAGIVMNALQLYLNSHHREMWGDIWDRLWPWMVFFHVNRGYVTDPFMLRPHPCLNLLHFIVFFNADEDARARIRGTVGLRSIVMEAWKILLKTGEGRAHPEFTALCTVLPNLRMNHPDHFQEILDGANGVSGLAELIVDTISLFSSPLSPVQSLATIFGELERIMVFLHRLGNEDTVLPAISELAGGARIFTAAGTICLSPEARHNHRSAANIIVLQCLIVLSTITSGYRGMCESLAAGLLELVLYAATISPNKHILRGTKISPKQDNPLMLGLRLLVKRILPASTVYHAVLTEMETQLQNVKHTGEEAEFQSSWVYKDWLSFTALAEDRIAFMKYIQSKDSISFKACCNTECGIICERAKFKRCSDCRTVYYCSAECQKMDWRHGGHRDSCAWIRTFASKNKDIGTRNLAFMRQMLHRDLTQRRFSAAFPVLDPKHILFLHDHAQLDGIDPFVTVMDYRQGRPVMHIHTLSAVRDGDEKEQIYWEEHVSRMARSGGRIELHMMLFQDGISFEKRITPCRRVMFPQWSDRPAFHGYLRRILEEGKNDVDEQLAELRAESDVVKIHQTL
ncbi:hypothetical protein C8R45DRAFT_1147470 [Mycena sanguinolenta]|nr:hypothetical protein C8R45DRAFT_1147470 [Mycena sanguinolenta]